MAQNTNTEPIHLVTDPRVGSVCGELGPQNPWNPETFYSCRIDHTDCVGCAAVYAAETFLSNDLTSVQG